MSSSRLQQLPKRFWPWSRQPGIQLSPRKHASLRSVLMEMPVPPILYYPLQTASGAALRAIVQPGDSILKGQKIAEPTIDAEVALFAASSGTVMAIEQQPRCDGVTGSVPLLILKTDGEDRWIATKAEKDWENLAPDQLIEGIQNAGVVGLGGCSSPTYRKLKECLGAELLVINAMESEPFVSADQALLREYADTVIGGARILQRACGARRCLLAISRDQPDAIAAVQRQLSGSGPELRLLPSRYPLGEERQLIAALTGRNVPTGISPNRFGVTVFNAGTAKAVYDAITAGRPLVSRVTTVCGDSVRTPKNFFALLGTPASFLLSLCGVDPALLTSLIVGGPLRGTALTSADIPVLPDTNCLIASSEKQFAPASPEQPCIGCDRCSSVCPARLMPQYLIRALQAEQDELARQHNLDDCIECGACDWACPSHIPLLQHFRQGKLRLQTRQVRHARNVHWRQQYENRQERLQREAVRHAGSRRRSISRPDRPDTASASLKDFSRETARQEIAAAVERVKARRTRPAKKIGEGPESDTADNGDAT